MPHIRLVGLVLFITTLFIALAAVTTQTTHIELYETAQPVAESDGPTFRSIPIAWPLIFAGLLGLFLWFTPAAASGYNQKPKRRRKRRKSGSRPRTTTKR